MGRPDPLAGEKVESASKGRCDPSFGNPPAEDCIHTAKEKTFSYIVFPPCFMSMFMSLLPHFIRKVLRPGTFHHRRKNKSAENNYSSVLRKALTRLKEKGLVITSVQQIATKIKAYMVSLQTCSTIFRCHADAAQQTSVTCLSNMLPQEKEEDTKEPKVGLPNVMLPHRNRELWHIA